MTRDEAIEAQRRRIAALKGAAKRAKTLDAKIQAQAKVRGAQEELRRMKLTYFDKEGS